MCKNINREICVQRCLIKYFYIEIWKNIVIFKITTSNLSECKNSIWGPKMHFWIFFGCNFEKPLPFLKLALPNLLKCKVLWKNKNPWTWDQICHNSVFFGLILRCYCHFWNHHPQTFQIQIFVQNTKTSNLRIKLFHLGIFRLRFWKAIIVFEIFSNLLKWKSLGKDKNPEFGPKMPYLAVF